MAKSLLSSQIPSAPNRYPSETNGRRNFISTQNSSDSNRPITVRSSLPQPMASQQKTAPSLNRTLPRPKVINSSQAFATPRKLATEPLMRQTTQQRCSSVSKTPTTGLAVSNIPRITSLTSNKTKPNTSVQTKEQRSASYLPESSSKLPTVCVFSDRNVLIKKEQFRQPESRLPNPVLKNPLRTNGVTQKSGSFVSSPKETTKIPAASQTLPRKHSHLPTPLVVTAGVKTDPVPAKPSSRIPRVSEINPKNVSSVVRSKLPTPSDAVKRNPVAGAAQTAAGCPVKIATERKLVQPVVSQRRVEEKVIQRNSVVDVDEKQKFGVSSDLGYVSEKEKSPDDDDDVDGDVEFIYGSVAVRRKNSDGRPRQKFQLDRKQVLDYMLQILPKDKVFTVVVRKTSQGLGFSITAAEEVDFDTNPSPPPELLNFPQFANERFIRIKKVFPHGAAWESGQLQSGDILLAANQTPLTGLSHTEALEVLRCCPSNTELLVFRTGAQAAESVVQPSAAQRQWLTPLCPLAALGEFEVTLTKVNGSLGFTLRKEDESILGHYIRSLSKEPALTDGRIKPGDKIVSVNGVDISSMSHAEAVAFLRRCPETVTIRLFRDSALTPLSPASPVEPETAIYKPRPVLRQEAQELLQDLAARKNGSCGTSPSTSFDSASLPRRKRLTKTPSPDLQSVVRDRFGLSGENYLSGSGSLLSTVPMSPLPEIESESLEARPSPLCIRKEIQRSDSDSTTINNPPESTSKTQRPNSLDLSNSSSLKKQRFLFTPPGEKSTTEPSTTVAIQQTPPPSNPSSEGTNGLLKWKGIVMADEDDQDLEDIDAVIETIELKKGWTCRLGFSLGLSSDDRLIISAIYEDSLASRDGRLRVGDYVLRVNGENVANCSKDYVVDILRKAHGCVSITIQRNRG